MSAPKTDRELSIERHASFEAGVNAINKAQGKPANYKLPDVGHIPGPPVGWRDANGQRAYEKRIADNAKIAEAAAKAGST